MEQNNSEEIVTHIREIAEQTSKMSDRIGDLVKDINPFVRDVIVLENQQATIIDRLESLEAHKERHCDIVDRGEKSLVSKMAAHELKIVTMEKWIEGRETYDKRMRWLLVSTIIVALVIKAIALFWK